MSKWAPIWAPPRGFRFAGKFCPETNQRRRSSGIGALWLSSPETKERPPFFLDELVNFFLFSQAQQRWVFFTMGNCWRRMQGKQVTGTMFIRKAVPDNFKLCNPDQNLLIKELALFQELGSCPPPHHRGHFSLGCFGVHSVFEISLPS